MKVTVTADPTQPSPKNYIQNLLEALSQFLGSIVGLNANLTFSAHAGYWQVIGQPFLKHLHKPVNVFMSMGRIAGNIWLTVTGKPVRRSWINTNHCIDAWKERV